jgi:hypothetical protein
MVNAFVGSAAVAAASLPSLDTAGYAGSARPRKQGQPSRPVAAANTSTRWFLPKTLRGWV